jgi:hypothetical protein
MLSGSGQVGICRPCRRQFRYINQVRGAGENELGRRLGFGQAILCYYYILTYCTV